MEQAGLVPVRFGGVPCAEHQVEPSLVEPGRVPPSVGIYGQRWSIEIENGAVLD